MQPSPIKVLIIDDSALVRDMSVITSDSDFVVGAKIRMKREIALNGYAQT